MREEEGRQKLISGIPIAAGALVSAVAIVGSLGTATPAVIATYAPYVVGTLGATSFLYGTSEAVEGIENIYYGSTGDIETVAINPIRDLLPEDMRGVYYAAGQGSTIALNILAMATGFGMIYNQYGWAGVGIEAGKIGITGAATYGVGEALEAGGADGSTIMLVQLGTTMLVYGTLSGIQSAVLEPQEVGNAKPPKLEGEGSSGGFRDLMTPEEVARYDQYWNNVADDMLKSNVNSYRQAILNGEITKTTGGKINSKVITAAIDTNTGDVYFGISGMNNNPTRNAINPQMKAILDSIDGSMTNYPLENCGEFNAINNALNNGVDINALRVYSIDRVGGGYKAPCINCQNLYGNIVHFTE